MASYAPRLLVASSAGIAFSSMFVGANAALTYIALPTLLLPSPSSATQKPSTEPGHLARQWQKIYNIGKNAGPGLALPGAVAFVYASRLVATGAILPRNLFIAAAVCNVLVIPFTGLVMIRTNNELHRRANSASAGETEVSVKKGAKTGSVESLETPELIHYWGNLSIVRASFHLVAIGLGIAALVS